MQHLRTALPALALVALVMTTGCSSSSTPAADGDTADAELVETSAEISEEATFELDEETAEESSPETEEAEPGEDADAVEGDRLPEMGSDAEAEAEDTGPNLACRDAGFDAYFGSLCYTAQATGYFRVEQIDGQWWLITPEGRPFFSTGVNVLSIHGSAAADGTKHYYDACIAKYGDAAAWSDAQFARCRQWGVNTAGGWSQWELFKDRLPFTVTMGLAGSDWLEGTAVDFFAEGWAASVAAACQKTAAPLKDNPFLIGYFLDNELHWSRDHRSADLLQNFMAMGAETPGKQRLMAFLRQRYASIDDLMKDFAVTVASFEELAAKTSLKAKLDAWQEMDEGALATLDAWTEIVAERYFSVTDAALAEADPNHLNLGVRFISQMTPRGAIAAAGRYVDVMTINYYDMTEIAGVSVAETAIAMDPQHLRTDDDLAAHYLAGGRPIMVTEWGFRASDSGLPNSYPPIYPVLATQTDRADAYEAKFRRLLALPWFVGQHWFQYQDQPAEGRFDGENNNFGLVNEADDPYDALVERFAAVYQDIYIRLPRQEPSRR